MTKMSDAPRTIGWSKRTWGGAAEQAWSGAEALFQVARLAAPDPDPPRIDGTEGDDTMTGTEGPDTLNGLGGNDTINGLGGDDILFGGSGNDVMDGGEGNDAMDGGLNDDIMDGGIGDDDMNGAGGNDTLRGGVGADWLKGRGGNDTLLGGDGIDLLDSNEGDDILDGGAGADMMFGNVGNDIYYVDDPNDTYTEVGGHGANDTVRARISYVIPNDANHRIETLAAADPGATDPLSLTGNQYTLLIIGNAGNNTISGIAGAVLRGGAGDDTYFTSTHSLFELAGEGFDTVFYNGDFQLPADSEVEELRTTDPNATGARVVRGSLTDNYILTGNGNDILDGGGGGHDVLEGRGGNDSYIVDSADDIVLETGGQGNDTLHSGASYILAPGVSIETLSTVNSGATTAIDLTGNEFANLLSGNAGANRLDGGAGSDTLQGQGGADIFAFTTALGAGDVDVITDLVSGADKIGLDENIFAGVTAGNLATVFVNGASAQDSDDRLIYNQSTGELFYDADGNGAGAQQRFAVLQNAGPLVSGDFVMLSDPGGQTLTGTPGDDELIGGVGDDTIDALAGNDLLDGQQGADTMNGGPGDDSIFVDNQADIVIEGSGGGFDFVFAAVTYQLAAGVHVEGLGTVNNLATTAINVTGNEFDNYVTGNAGANILDGGSGGADQLWGREGNDSYFVDADDAVAEYAGHGNDTVYARASYALRPGLFVETLAAANALATDAINLTGNELDNLVVGNAGANTLDGGTGIDQLQGREGNDSYFVDGNDRVVELAGQGADIIYARTSYALAASVSIETLATANNLATDAINLTGNELDNYVTGNAGANTLDGGTGGADLLWAREGNDSYFVDSNDVIIEYAGHGHDIVYARSNHALSAGFEIEVLGTIDSNATSAIDLAGNELANFVTGNAGANRLDGGAGADQLFGRGGADTFAFTTTLGVGNVDAVLDFVSGTDLIGLDDAIFSGIGAPGNFNANAFRAGSGAQDSDDRIVYNSATGQLFYDADGNGGGAQVLFAVLSGAPAVAASDFIVI